MTDLVAYLTVLIAAAIPWLEVLVVVPAGILAGLSPIPVMVVAAIGNVATLVPLVLLGDRLRAWWRERRRHQGDETPRSGRGARAQALVDRYGVPGLAALGPLVTGVHVAAIAALASGADRGRTLVWLTGGVIAWSAITGIATIVGIEALVEPGSLPDFFATVTP